jgi:hypothetical protein
MIAFVIICGLCALTSLLGLAYPALFGWYHWRDMTAIQLVCLAPCVASLAASLALLPAALRYAITNAALDRALYRDDSEVTLAADMYDSLPLRTLRAVAVLPDAIPHDAFDAHVLPFLAPRMVGLYGMAGAAAARMRTVLDELE